MKNIMYNKDIQRGDDRKGLYFMNSRQYEILKTLYREKGFTTLENLANLLNVSVKTIRNDISYLKEYIDGEGVLETRPHVGVSFTADESQWKNITAMAKENDDAEIVYYIIKRLLKDGELTAWKLSEKYYMSRTQTEKVLKTVEKWFSKQHILFERKRGKGIYIQCNEFNYRIGVLNFFSEFTDIISKEAPARESIHSTMSANEYSAMCALLDGLNPDTVQEIVLKVERENGLKFSYTSNVNLIMLLSLSVLRSRKGNTVSMDRFTAKQSITDIVFGEKAFEYAQQSFNIKLSDNEKKYFVFAFSISEVHSFDSQNDLRHFETENIELCRETVKLVNLISDITENDLRHDRFFVRQMFLQLKPMIARLKFGVDYKNRLLPQIKDKYPNLMAIAWTLENFFEKELGLKINEHEVGLIALYIGGAIERRLAGTSACIVCDYGIGISQILKEKISRKFSDLQITSVLSNRDMASIKKEICDFVISTVPLDGYRISKDVVVVSHLFDNDDVKKIEEKIRSSHLSKKNNVTDIYPNISLFTEELVFLQSEYKLKDDLLSYMCEKLESLGYVNDKFKETVFDRENSTSTEIGKGIAIPHGLSEYVNRSAVAFMSLKKPVKWRDDSDDVDLIFLLAFDPDESEQVKKIIKKFYKSFVSLTEVDEKLKGIRNITDKHKFIKLFKTL